MQTPYAITSLGGGNNNWTTYNSLSNLTQLWLYNDYINGNDNNLLSAAWGETLQGPVGTCLATECPVIFYEWYNYN